jgi:hypothetical protein
MKETKKEREKCFLISSVFLYDGIFKWLFAARIPSILPNIYCSKNENLDEIVYIC